MSMGKVKVDSIDDNEEMQIMDEVFDILGFTNQEKTDVYRISAICMKMSRLELLLQKILKPVRLEMKFLGLLNLVKQCRVHSSTQNTKLVQSG